MNIVMLGAPGSGKGTQATRLSARFNIPHISSGDIFRKNIMEKTPVGLEAKSYIDKGNLVPDDITVKIIKERLTQGDCKDGFILDGFPRTIVQAAALERIVKIDLVVSIDIGAEKLIERLRGRRVCPNCNESYHTDYLGGKTTCAKCGAALVIRSDDDEQTVHERIAVYQKQTAPLKGYYEDKGTLFSVVSEGGIDAVQAIIAAKIARLKEND